MKSILKIGILFISCIFLLASCEEDETNALTYLSGGYIKGTLVGVSEEGIALNETFNYSQYEYYDQSSYEIGLTENYFDVARGDINNMCWVGISFIRSTTGLISGVEVGIDYAKKLDNNKVLSYYASTWSGVTTSNVMDVLFDPNTNKLSGKFSASIDKVDGLGNSHVATLTGEFDVTVYQIVYK